MNPHQALIVDQFTRQADGFAASAAIRDEQALSLMLEHCHPRRTDHLLDVACGPGLVVCAFARHVRSAIGIDLTEKMLDRARALASTQALRNTEFRLGDVNSLPFTDQSFDLVTSRYAFHHFLEPARVLAEMRRVCRPRGRIAVMDMLASEDPRIAANFHQMEKWRDPSHVAALSLSALQHLFREAGLPPPIVARYRMPVMLDALLATSFPNEGDRERVRELVESSLEQDSLGVQTQRRDGKIGFSYPIALLVSTLD